MEKTLSRLSQLFEHRTIISLILGTLAVFKPAESDRGQPRLTYCAPDQTGEVCSV
ncbi:MAG: hypothetical protein AAF526_13875 [Pseudomonadota bacterium]